MSGTATTVEQTAAPTPAPAATPVPVGKLESIADYRTRRAEVDTLPDDDAPKVDNPPAKVDKPAEAQAAQPATDAEQVPANETPEQKAEREGKKRSLQSRIDEITAQRETERREKEQLRAELETLKRGQQPAQPGQQPAPQQPQPAQYDGSDPNDPIPDEATFFAKNPEATYGQFMRAVAEATARQIARVERFNLAQTEQQRAQLAAFNRAHAAGKADFADFDDVLNGFAAAGGRFHPFVQDVVLNHPLGHKVAYELAKNPADHAKFSTFRSVAEAGIEMGKILARIEGAPKPAAKAEEKPAAVSNAPAPVPVLVGGDASASAASPDPSKVNSVATWRQMRKQYD